MLNYISVEKNSTVVKANSVVTNHYWRPQDASCLTNLQKSTCPAVTLPDGSSLHPTQQGILPLTSILSSEARRATILHDLKSASPISLGQLCNDDCKVLLNKKSLHVFKDKDLVLKGTRNTRDRLWDVPLHNPNPLQASYHQPPIHPSIYPKNWV